MRVLVTGGAGFIGSHLVEGLVSAGHSVRVLDNLSAGSWANLDSVRDVVECVEGDVTDSAAVRRCVEGVDTIFHEAADPSVAHSLTDPVLTNAINVTGTLNILSAARDAGVRRVVYAGSCATYGDGPELPKSERMPPRPGSPYAVSKLAGELYCGVFSSLYGLETVCLRYFNVFGPRQDPNSPYAAVIPRFIQALAERKPVPIDGDGTQTRDFVYVMNVVQANLRAMSVPDLSGGVFNIAMGQSISLNNLLDSLVSIMAATVRIERRPPRRGDVPHSLADITLACARLGYSPEVDLWEGLRRTVEWMRSRPSGSP